MFRNDWLLAGIEPTQQCGADGGKYIERKGWRLSFNFLSVTVYFFPSPEAN
jgi:hypothetical protein